MLGLALLLAGLALVGAGLWLLLKPAQFAATARIWTEPPHLSAGSDYSYDPYFIQTEFEILQSQLVLGSVVTNLNLNEKWGAKYSKPSPLKTTESIAIIKNQLRLAPVRGTRLIAITFQSYDRQESAQVANAIAEAYQNYRITSRAEAVAKGLQILQQQYRDVEEKIRVAQTNVDLLRENYQRKKELDTMIEFQKLLGSKIKDFESDQQQPQASSVQITNRAEPPPSPIGPNRVLGAVLLGLGLFSLAGGILLLKPVRR